MGSEMIIIHVIHKYDKILNSATIIDQFFFSGWGCQTYLFVGGEGGSEAYIWLL